VRRRSGAGIIPFLRDAARLRIAVFREFPYLYAGSEESEADYLESYASCPESVFVLAEAAGRVVGVSTGLPLAAADAAFQEPFKSAGMDPREWFYFGESVLDPAWRGLGIGRRFFDEREDHARGLGFLNTCFCAVERPADHPLKPAGYRGNENLWARRGYELQARLRCRFSWCQVDAEGAEIENELVFRTRTGGVQM
jgi:GNAT superfamily N-acetyltransferase